MTLRKNKSAKQRKVSPVLMSIFKLKRQDVGAIKRTGAGVHKSGPKYKSRAEQKRRAIDDESQY